MLGKEAHKPLPEFASLPGHVTALRREERTEEEERACCDVTTPPSSHRTDPPTPKAPSPRLSV